MSTSPTYGSNSPILPFDVWEHIAHYVPDDQLERLYSLNRSLFQLAMSIRYRKLLVRDYLYAVEIPRCKWYRLLYHPHCAQYVRSLTLEHTNLVIPQREYISSDYEIGLKLQTAKGWEWAKKFIETRISLWLFCDTREGRDHKALNSDFAKFFASLTDLTSLTIKWTPFPSYAPVALDSFNPLLTAGWKALGRTLTTLTIQMQLDYLPRLLTTSLNFELLETFTIMTQPVKRERKPTLITPDILLTTVVPFINRHSGTLQSLYIGWKDFDLPIAIFSSFEKLPHLRHFTVSGSILGLIPGAGKPGLEGFLIQNANSLVEIHWHFSRPSERPPSEIGPLEQWFNEASYSFILPNLKKLTLSNPTRVVMFKSIHTMASYVARHAKSLTSLSLLDTKLDQNSLFTLSEAITSLTELEFTTYIFTFTMLTTLATTACPHLKTLKLSYTLLGRQNPGSQFAEYGRDKFAQDLQAVTPIRWGLRTLVLNGESGRYDQEGFRLEKNMLLGALVNVETVNGEPRAAILVSR